MRERHGDDLEIVMRTYTEKPRTEVDWKGFAYDPYLDGSSRISVGLVATRMLMCRITALGVPVAAEPLNALTPQYVNGLVTYNGVGARNVTDQTARERVSGLLLRRRLQELARGQHRRGHPGGRRRPGAARVPRRRPPRGERPAVDDGQRHRPRDPARRQGRPELLRRAHRRHQGQARARAGLPEVVVVDASHGNSQKNHLRQIDVVRDLAGQIAGGERAIRGVMVESNLVAGRQDLDQQHPERAGLRHERHRRLRRPRHDRGDAGRRSADLSGRPRSLAIARTAGPPPASPSARSSGVTLMHLVGRHRGQVLAEQRGQPLLEQGVARGRRSAAENLPPCSSRPT